MENYSESVVLKFKYKCSVIHVRVSLAKGLTWLWLANEVLRLYSMSMTRCKLKSERVFSLLASRNECLHLDSHLLPSDLQRLKSEVLFLQTEGPISVLPDEIIAKLFGFVGGAFNLNSLIRVSKRWHKIFLSDCVWCSIPFQTFCMWQGEGVAGPEREEWQAMQEESGLSISSIYRLRWFTHNTSRLRLFYGTLLPGREDPEHSSSIVRRLLQTLDKKDTCARTIYITSSSDNCFNASTAQFMRNIHYVVPESATEHHLSAPFAPFLPGGMRLDVEASPPNSRSRNHARDPGTSVECDASDYTFKYRRIGDNRLTFLSFDFDVEKQFNRPSFHYDSFYKLTEKVLLPPLVVMLYLFI
jgi:hypothetical protein